MRKLGNDWVKSINRVIRKTKREIQMKAHAEKGRREEGREAKKVGEKRRRAKRTV